MKKIKGLFVELKTKKAERWMWRVLFAIGIGMMSDPLFWTGSEFTVKGLILGGVIIILLVFGSIGGWD